jgi:23S rRNA pseudouridine2604 synthase
MSDGIRINKFLSEAGFCSRREADRLLEQGAITINEKNIDLGTRVQPNDQVKVHGELVHQTSPHVYIALNKPIGITCTSASNVPGNIVDYVNYPQRIFPIGRLDKPSEGLILLTNDGDIVNKILRAGNNHEKEYLVHVDKPINNAFMAGMSQGVPVLDTITNKCTVLQTSQFGFKIILTQGLNRQIRRMCEFFGYNVTKLKRMRIMNISIDNLGTGKWRHLTTDEVDEIHKLVHNSKKTYGHPIK